MLKIVIIIDEAQASYDDFTFWANLVKPVAYNFYGPMIALFSSFGSPYEGPGIKIVPMTFTLVRGSGKVYSLHVIKQSFIFNLETTWGIKKYLQIKAFAYGG